MYISKNIRVKLTEEEKRTLHAAAKICDELGEALGEVLADDYDIDIAGIYDNLLRISREDCFEYVDEDVLIH